MIPMVGKKGIRRTAATATATAACFLLEVHARVEPVNFRTKNRERIRNRPQFRDPFVPAHPPSNEILQHYFIVGSILHFSQTHATRNEIISFTILRCEN
uniref:Putative secreted protein n=1 Tax=Anopheles darlingi TaxID=43151 RepID=A0A2M4D5Q7_ANODA